MRINRRKREVVNPNIVSMIDIVFVLVVFFIFFTSFSSSHEGIRVNLPSSTTAQPQLDDSFVVTVGADGQLYFNEEEVNQAGVERRVREIHTRNPDVLGIIQADGSVSYDAIIDVVDLVRQSGVGSISLAASLEIKE